jgi:hypothetical protein
MVAKTIIDFNSGIRQTFQDGIRRLVIAFKALKESEIPKTYHTPGKRSHIQNPINNSRKQTLLVHPVRPRPSNMHIRDENRQRIVKTYRLCRWNTVTDSRSNGGDEEFPSPDSDVICHETFTG